MGRRWRFDDLDHQTGLFFEQELTSVRTEVLQKEQPPKNVFEVLPQETSDPDYVEEIEVRMWDVLGRAEFISDYGDDLPVVGVDSEKDKYNVREFGCAYQYSRNEIRKASETGKQLERKKAIAAREFVERKFNTIGFYGAPVAGLFGLLNFPHFPRRQISLDYNSNANSEDVLDSLNAFVNSAFSQVRGNDARAPDTLLMPPDKFAYIGSTPWSSSAGDTTILSHFRQNNFFIDTVRPVRELAGAGPTGEDVMVCFRNSDDVISHNMVMEFTQGDPFRKSPKAWIVPATGKSGGVTSQFPLECIIGEFPS